MPASIQVSLVGGEMSVEATDTPSITADIVVVASATTPLDPRVLEEELTGSTAVDRVTDQRGAERREHDPHLVPPPRSRGGWTLVPGRDVRNDGFSAAGGSRNERVEPTPRV